MLFPAILSVVLFINSLLFQNQPRLPRPTSGVKDGGAAMAPVRAEEEDPVVAAGLFERPISLKKDCWDAYLSGKYTQNVNNLTFLSPLCQEPDIYYNAL
jgi:hypothetical protein